MRAVTNIDACNTHNGLPRGWEKARVSDLVDLINGYAFKPSDWSKQGLPIIRIQNLNTPAAIYNYYSNTLPDKFSVETGELLFAWSGTPGTSFGAHIWKGPKAWLNQHIFKVLFDENYLDKRFLRLAINQNLNEYIAAAHGGAGLAHITKGRFEESELQIPPLAEQRRIVGEVEKQCTRLDAAVEALKRVRAKLTRYRASVLKAACEGRLVLTEAELADAEGRDYEPAQVLVQRVLKERRAAWEERELTRTAHAQQASRRTETRVKYREAASVSTSDLPALPRGWLWISIEALLSEPMCNGISVKGSKNPPGVPALKLNAMTDRGFQYNAVRYIPISKAMTEDLKIVAGDFFVARGNGSLKLVGRGTRAQEAPFEVVFPDTMIRLRFVPSASSTAWVPTIWPSALVRRQIQAKIKTTAGIWKIAQPQVASIVVPLPPLAEQHRIVSEVERRQSVIQELEALVNANLKRSERLRRSILKRAFDGKLVPQDPNDEPASVLLERIRVGRKAMSERAASRERGNRKKKKRA